MTISKTGVKLGVANATSLPDPQRLFQGSGKNVRHVPLSKDLEQTGLDDLIRAARTRGRSARAECASTIVAMLSTIIADASTESPPRIPALTSARPGASGPAGVV